MESKLFERYINEMPIEELIELLKNEIAVDSLAIDSRFQLAKLYLKKNEFSNAINTFTEILQIEPNNEEATIARENALAIVSQSQLDIYACPNTHIDPWV